jgi:DNA end-binding protein Ku
MAVRPYGSGQIRLSLVSLPVNMYPALNRSRQIPLHEIYRPTGQRVHHQNVVDDKSVDKEDIVKDYEIEKGEYVILEPDEIAKLKIPSKKVLDIVQFVSADMIDDIYFEIPYFGAPAEDNAEDAFIIIREALRATGKIGLGQLAIAGRERLCAIRPCGSGIMLETLRYEDEIRKSDPYFEDIGKPAIDKEQLSLAKELIKRKTSSFTPKKFYDHYREALEKLIKAKSEHRVFEQPEEEKSSGKVINLMDALRKSLKEPAKKDAPSSPKHKAAKPKTKTSVQKKKSVKKAAHRKAS